MQEDERRSTACLLVVNANPIYDRFLALDLQRASTFRVRSLWVLRISAIVYCSAGLQPWWLVTLHRLDDSSVSDRLLSLARTFLDLD